MNTHIEAKTKMKKVKKNWENQRELTKEKL